MASSLWHKALVELSPGSLALQEPIPALFHPLQGAERLHSRCETQGSACKLQPQTSSHKKQWGSGSHRLLAGTYTRKKKGR